MKRLEKKLSLTIVLILSALLVIFGATALLARTNALGASAAMDESVEPLCNYGMSIYVYDPDDVFEGDPTITGFEEVNAAIYANYETILNGTLSGEYADMTSKLGAAYTITFYDYDESVIANPGRLFVRMQVPSSINGEGKTFVVVNYTAEGTTSTASLVAHTSVEMNGLTYLEFEITASSVYAIAELTATPVASISWVWALIAIIMVLLVATILLLVCMLLRKGPAKALNGDIEETVEEMAIAEEDGTMSEAEEVETPAKDEE